MSVLLVVVGLIVFTILLIFTSNASSIDTKPELGTLYLKQINIVPITPTWVELAKADSCWSELIFRESGWRITATNPTSGAYGLPQSLPPRKMASVGDDWLTNPETQLEWMSIYIKNRYGNSCTALNFQIKMNWY